MIADMMHRLQQVKHYKCPSKALDTLLSGFCRKEKLSHGAKQYWEKSGQMPYSRAVQFAKYCLDKDWLDMML